MKIGVIHYNFPQFNFEQFLDYCPEAGFGYVELQISDVWGSGVENPEAEAEKVLQQVQARGLQVSAGPTVCGTHVGQMELGSVASPFGTSCL